MRKYGVNNLTYWVFILSLGLLSFASSAEDVFRCPEQFGYYPDMDDCTKYYTCVFGDSHHEKCTGGLFFSIELQTCDWPRNVECANGMQPAERVLDDEDFSPSRRTSTTRVQRPIAPNSESVSNIPSFDEQETRKVQRNSTVFSLARPQPSRTPAPVKTPSPTSQTTTTESPALHTLLTTLQDENGPIPSTVSEDPLYAIDDQLKVSDPQYDHQLPEYSLSEDSVPIVISDGRDTIEIRIPDDGHIPHIPNIGDYRELKQVDNSGNPAEGASVEEHGYPNKVERNKDNPPNYQSTQGRFLGSGTNDYSRDPDVDYTNNKGIDNYNIPNWQSDYATPPPIIFDDNADHRVYKELDTISVPSNNRKDANSDLGDRNPIPDISSNNGHSKDTDVKITRNTNRISTVDHGGRGNEKSTVFFLSCQEEDCHRLNQNSGRPADQDIRINPNKNVDFDTIVTTNNGKSKDEDAERPHQINPIRPFSKEYSIPEISHPSRNKEIAAEVSPSRPREQNNQNVKEGDLPRDPKPSSGQNRQDISHTLPAINSPTKDVDDTYIDGHSDGDFGVYMGGQRQNTKNNADRDIVKPEVTIRPQTSEENLPQQSNKPRHPVPKEYPRVILDAHVPEETPDQTFDEQYGDLQRGFGGYDSPRPTFTEDYYTNEDSETTTRTTITTTSATTTAKASRTRPTRPRRTTTPPTTTTTTTTTPAPIRIRTRKPLTPATRAPNKPAYVATTPASPPYRPPPLFPTPIPLSSAQKCDPRKCKLPDCRCGGTDIPGEFSTREIPQIVLLTFDDAVNDLNHDLYNELFNSGRVNPNGCPILGTFYISHEWTDYGQVQSLYSHGHEIASHSITHSYGEKFSKNQWLREIHGQREILHMYGGVKMEDIRGMRAPFLQIGGNKMFEMLYDANFTYDSSMPVYENDPPFWPYTLDYALTHECMIFPCPTKAFPGLWEVGMIMWVDLRGGRCSMGDACSNPGDEESVTKMLMKNFNRHYQSNRAPFGLFYHSAWFNTQVHRRGFMKFLDEILKNDDVWLVTNWQAIEWIRNPTPSAKMKDFEPFDCRKLDRPPPCPSPTVCNVWYQGGVRYMKTCQPCPAKYPWVGNTGYDSNSRG